jgi:hypothetical protein
MPHGTLQVFIIILYKNVFQNSELFCTQVRLSPEQSTLAPASDVAGGHSLDYRVPVTDPSLLKSTLGPWLR